MKKYLLLICILFSSNLLAVDSWPVGKWNMLDDFTELPEAIIQISATKAGGFEGKIIEVFPDPEDDPLDVCKSCVGLDKNKPIIVKNTIALPLINYCYLVYFLQTIRLHY